METVSICITVRGKLVPFRGLAGTKEHPIELSDSTYRVHPYDRLYEVKMADVDSYVQWNGMGPFILDRITLVMDEGYDKNVITIEGHGL